MGVSQIDSNVPMLEQSSVIAPEDMRKAGISVCAVVAGDSSFDDLSVEQILDILTLLMMVGAMPSPPPERPRRHYR